MRLALVFTLFFAAQSALAEYRVFTLMIINSKTNASQQIQTTLDPEQYRTLYPLQLDESISYVDSWMCFGRTDNLRSHCEKPAKREALKPSLDRKPASLDQSN